MAWVVEIPSPEPRSTLPVGGCPADDRAYLAWRDEFLWREAERDYARRWHDAADRPIPLHAWALDAHLFRELGARPMFGRQDTPIRNHRLRFLAIALRKQHRKVHESARRFVEEVARHAL